MPHTRKELLSWAKDAWEKITGKHQEKMTIVSGYPATEIYDYKIHEMELVFFQFLLFRYWFRNKNDEGVFEFEPINIHGPEIHPSSSTPSNMIRRQETPVPLMFSNRPLRTTICFSVYRVKKNTSVPRI